MMDSAGNLNLTWAQGYDGSAADFVSSDVLMYKCGNILKFQSVSSGVEDVFPHLRESFGPVAGHGNHNVFAIAEGCIKPKINIYQYPLFDEVISLEDGAELEYVKLVFSISDYLISVSGVPDFKLTLWRYTDGTPLCSEPLHDFLPNIITINPSNWRHLCLSSDDKLEIWTVEQSNTVCIMKKEKIKLPPTDPMQEETMTRDQPTRASTRMGRAALYIPPNAVAGVKGDDAEKFDTYQDEIDRCIPVTHCWTPSGHVLIGCEKGQLLKIDSDEYRIQMLYNATVVGDSLNAFSAENTDVSDAQLDRHKSSLSQLPEESTMITSGSFNCLGLHKNGLFAAGKDGTIRLMDITGNKVKVKERNQILTAVSMIAFSPSHDRLAVGSTSGEIYSLDPTNIAELNLLLSIKSGDFISVGMMCPGNELCVTARELGEIQVWNASSGKLVATFNLGIQITSMACSPITHVVVLGTVSGYVYFVDFNSLKSPRIIQRVRLYQGKVKHLCFNYSGQIILTGSNENHVFIVDGRATTEFQTVGSVEVPGDIQDLCTLYDDKTHVTKVVLSTNTTNNEKLGATKIVQFDLPGDINNDITNKYDSLKGNLRQDIINCQTFTLAVPSFGIATAPGSVAYSLSQSTKALCKLSLPTEKTKKESMLQSLGEFPAHQLVGGHLSLAPHERWLASIGEDGIMTVRAVGALERPIEINAHDFNKKGARDFVFSSDASQIFTVGNDGVLAGFTWDLSSKGKQACQAAQNRINLILKQTQATEEEAVTGMVTWELAMSASRPGSGIEKAEQEHNEKEEEILKAIETDMIFTTPTPTPNFDATWLEVKELESLKEDERQYADTKRDLRMEIRDVRRTLKGMMSENEDVTDIERLGHHEFDLDIEEQQRLQKEGDAEVARIREEREFDNLAKTYLADLIKKECWDSMEVKGRGIAAFDSTMEVNNYPMKARTNEEAKELENVINQRKIEIEDIKLRKEFADITHKHNSAAELKLTIEDRFNYPHEEEEGEAEDLEGDGKEQPSTTGSLGIPTLPSEQYGGASEYFYSQFELHARSQKMNQIVLLQDAIHRIKKTFNKEFDQTFTKKESEINKIKDKNKRIRKILEDLNMDPEIYEPELGSIEKPEMLLTVADSESLNATANKRPKKWTVLRRRQIAVKVEKYLTAEQQKLIEEERVADEERRAREKGDNWRGRGLDKMMGGVLEVKREDELKKDIPIPVFMQQREESEWNDEEKKIVAEYHKKCADLEEEREKYHKQLEQELRKLQQAITEGTHAFDEVLQQLFYRKVKTEMVIYQEELKILRLKNSLLMEEELANFSKELLFDIDHKKLLKQLSFQALKESRENVDQFKESYDNLVAEDKLMEKEFRKDFHDVPAFIVDQLFKFFKKRPKGQKARDLGNPAFHAASGNPFFQRPPTATQNAMDRKVHENVLRDMDSPNHMPEGCEEYVWERLCMTRRRKIESEYLVKQKALILADMTSFQNKRQTEDEKYREDIDEIQMKLSRLKEDRNRFTINLEVQLLLKQGQVEIDAGPFTHNFIDSLLINRTVIEDLNHRIRQLGEVKIGSMLESKDFRKSIVQLEWEHKKMKMEMEDFQKKMRDIQNLKVTREIQAFLNEDDHDAKKLQEISSLEQTIVAQKQHHEKHVQTKKRIIRDLNRTIKDKESENSAISVELEELNVTVNERRHIHEVNADKQSDAGAEKRYREIVERRKLVDLAKAQAQEVAVLRAEVERLRMRTFPALVQVEH